MNNRIFAKSVQVISETGQNLGIMPTAQALAMAGDAGLDLVEINANNTPPIVKIMDYGKFKYDQKKRANEARKNQKMVEMKEVWVKPFIEENDLNIKMKKVFEFLDGAVPELFARIMELVGERGTLESKSKPDERTKSIIVAPVKAK